MRAAICTAFGDPDTLEIRDDLPPPTLRPGTVRIRAVAAGVNFADTLIVRGLYQLKPPFPFSPGIEAAGTVVEAAADVTGFAPGDRVMAMNELGMYAGEVVVPATHVFKVPAGMDIAAAAGFAIVYGTAYGALTWRARLHPGETVLVLGAAGGLGLAAIEVAKALGATVIAAARGPAKLAAVLDHGADHAVDYEAENLRERLKELTGGRGADIVFDSVGGDVFDIALRGLAWEGRAIVLGFAGGRIQSIPANILLVKNITTIGFFWGHYRVKVPARVRAAFTELFAWWSEGRLRPHVSHRFDLAEVAQAMEILTTRRSIGKVVLMVEGAGG